MVGCRLSEWIMRITPQATRLRSLFRGPRGSAHHGNRCAREVLCNQLAGPGHTCSCRSNVTTRAESCFQTGELEPKQVGCGPRGGRSGPKDVSIPQRGMCRSGASDSPSLLLSRGEHKDKRNRSFLYFLILTNISRSL